MDDSSTAQDDHDSSTRDDEKKESEDSEQTLTTSPSDGTSTPSLSKLRLYLIFASLILSTFLVSLNGTIVATVRLPYIS
jgi:hypothetical protein